MDSRSRTATSRGATPRRSWAKYLETTNGDDGYYQHNTFWPTTPDILTAYVRDNGIAGHAVRAVLAAMGSPSWGIYNGLS